MTRASDAKRRAPDARIPTRQQANALRALSSRRATALTEWIGATVGWSKSIGSLQRLGWVAWRTPRIIAITDDGVAALKRYRRTP